MKFLVIDDDICIYSLLKKQITLHWKEAIVEHFNPAEQGIPHCNFKWSEYDIILLDYDIGLSSFNGLDILSRLNKADSFPIVIMITGEGNESVAVRAIQAGADDYLIKYDIITDRFYNVMKDAITLRNASDNKSTYISQNKLNPKNKPAKSRKNNRLFEHIDIPGYQCLETISNNVSLTLYAIRRKDSLPVALKLQRIAKESNANAVKRFNQELDLLSRLDHPNVIKIIDHGITDEYIYYSMEYVEHGDLSMTLEKGPIPGKTAKEYFLQVLNGVKALHEVNIIHRDIKAKNILFRTRNNPVIADLGSAKNLNGIGDITSHGEVIGTPYYMSPEQFSGKGIDHRTDIYSLGILFYEMIIGEKPYTGENIMEIVFKKSYEKPEKLPKSLCKYQDIIDAMLSINKEERFQKIDEVIAAVKNIN